MEADIEGAIQIVSVIADFDWTWSHKPVDLPRFLAATGWGVIEEHDGSAKLETNLRIGNPMALFFAGFLDSEQTVSVLVADLVDEDPASLVRRRVDVFAELCGRLEDILGRPSYRYAGEYSEMGWLLPKVDLSIVADEGWVTVRGRSPQQRR